MGGFSQPDVEALSAALDEPTWLLERRLEAWGYAEKLDLPKEKDEPWRYTDLRRLKFSLDRFTAAEPNPFDAGLALPRDPVLEERGVVVLPLYNAMQTRPDQLREHLFSQTNPGQDVFTALHGALFSGGTYIYVPPSVEVEVPIEAVRTVSQGGIGVFPHTLVVLGDGARLVFIDRSESEPLDPPVLSIPTVEVVAGRGASLNLVSIQEYGSGVWNFQHQHVALAAGASLTSLMVLLGGSFSRAEVRTALNGPAADASMLGLYFAEDDQHFDMRTLQDHAAPRCSSDLLYKGALKDRSHTVYSGLIRVQPGAEKTDAYQANRNLVLSDHAKADSKPELEILNNDVRCTHGSTVGQVDENQLFYLQSRGISPDEATRLIVEGFFEDVINRLNVEPVREALHSAIERKLGL